MLDEIELLLMRCEKLFSDVRYLAVRRRINPTARWFRDEINTTELDVRRTVALREIGPIAICEMLFEVEEALLDLKRKLKKTGGDGEDDIEFSFEPKSSPQRGKTRRGRDLFD